MNIYIGALIQKENNPQGLIDIINCCKKRINEIKENSNEIFFIKNDKREEGA